MQDAKLAADFYEQFGFQFMDWAVIVVYLIGMIVLSVYLGKGQEDQDDYYVGGRKLPWWAVGLSTMATQTSAVSFISIPAFVALKQGGGMSWLQYELAVPVAMVFIMFFLIPFFRNLNLISIYEYIEMRFGRAARYFLSAVFLISRGLGTAAGLFAGAIVLSVCFNLPLWFTIILIGVVTLIYDTIGGMTAVVYSDVIQMGILILGIILCCYYALADVGGIEGALKVFPAERLQVIDTAPKDGAQGPILQFLSQPFWAFLIGGFFLYASYYGCDQSQAQRELSAPTTDATKQSLIFNGFFRFPLTILYILMGVLVGAYVFNNPEFMNWLPVVKGVQDPNYMLPVFIMSRIPIGFRAVIFAAILAAVMSSMDSAINSLSASTMRDFVEQFIDMKGDNKKMLWFGRYTTIFWGIFVTAFAFVFGGGGETIVETINSIGSQFYGPILCAFILGVTFKRANGPGMIGGVLLGVVGNLIINKLYGDVIHWMWFNFIGFVISTVFIIVISYLTAEMDYEKVKHLLVWESEHMADEKRWGLRYGLLVIYFFIMLGVAFALPGWLSASGETALRFINGIFTSITF